MRLVLPMLENGKSADLKALAGALEQANSEGRLHLPDPGGVVHLVLVVAHFRANEMDLMKEHYRLLQLPQGWTPKIADAVAAGRRLPAIDYGGRTEVAPSASVA